MAGREQQEDCHDGAGVIQHIALPGAGFGQSGLDDAREGEARFGFFGLLLLEGGIEKFAFVAGDGARCFDIRKDARQRDVG